MMMCRKNLHRDGPAPVGNGGGGDAGYTEAYDNASEGAQNNSTTSETTQGASGNDGTQGSDPVGEGGQTEGSDQDGVTDADGEGAASEASADPAATTGQDYEQSVRDALMAALQKRFTDAQKNAQTSLKNGDAKGTEVAATEIMEVIQETQSEIDKLQKEAANDPVAKQKQMQLAKRLVDMTFYLKTLRTQIAERTKQSGLTGEVKKSFKDLSSDINKFLRNKAEREQTKQSEFFRNAKNELSKLTQIFQGKKEETEEDGATEAGTDVEAEAGDPATEEDKRAALEILPDDFTGVNGETGDLTSREQALVKQSVSQMKKAEEAKQFAETRDAQKTETANATEGAEATAQTAADNNGQVPTPNKQQMRSTIHLLMKSGRLNKDVGRDLLKELAEKGVATMTTSAGVFASKTDEEAYENCFSGLQEEAMSVLGLAGEGGEESADGVESRASKSGFRSSVCGLMTALKGGILRQKAATIAASREVTSQATYSGETVEAGQLAYSQLVGDGRAVTGAEDNKADHYQYQAEIDRELAQNGQVRNGRLIALDPTIPVGPVA